MAAPTLIRVTSDVALVVTVLPTGDATLSVIAGPLGQTLDLPVVVVSQLRDALAQPKRLPVMKREGVPA